MVWRLGSSKNDGVGANLVFARAVLGKDIGCELTILSRNGSKIADGRTRGSPLHLPY